MMRVRQTDEFRSWLLHLRDRVGKAILVRRIKRLGHGNAGDASSVGSGVLELRIHFGPGYRVYFIKRGADLVLLLCGGDKSSQISDIARAKKLAEEEAAGHDFEDHGV